MSYKYIGKGFSRKDAIEKVTGEAEYVQDMTFPGMLYAKLKTSPHAHALIKRIDTSKAEKLPGVKAVITGKEAIYKLGLYMVDRPVLAVGKVDTLVKPLRPLRQLISILHKELLN